MKKTCQKVLVAVMTGLIISSASFTAFAASDTESNSKTEITIQEANDSLPILDAKFRSEPTEKELADIEKNKGSIIETPSTKEITPEGYQRKYGAVEFTTTSMNNTFNFIGEASAYNGTSSSARLQYTQGTTKTTSWNVSTNVSGKSEVSAPFLAKIEATVGVGVSKSSTVSKSSSVLYEITVPSKKTGVISAYQKAVYASGNIKWFDYSPSGTYIRQGSDKVSGSAVIDGGIHYNSKTY